ncbi:sugar phosphate permease [Scopulibacillus darangshiensis]|uniref:Sugar phosphate permease n=1 Tax=Scopulibacillus darangshiensis TaxID=442528 RepID=A0A4V2SNE2_9BACL|nr:MFS transporter [Scopulibacillus darangshiensis]TCP30896.1 sugar phosphate permease [Scopulibacillus darangshiensis]
MKYRWFILGLLFVVYFIQFIDRTVISLATEPIMKEFHFSASEWGMILSAFFWGVVPFSIIAGIASDKWGAKRILLAGATIWSLFTALTALSFNYISFLIARAIFGAGESPSASMGIRIATTWYSPKEYSTALGVAFSGVYIAPAIASPVVVWLIGEFGWRMPFYVMGILGIIWVLFWYKYFTDRPENNPFMGQKEKGWLLAEQDHILRKSKAGKKKSIKELLGLPRHIRGTILANLWSVFCVGYALYFLLTWLPGYFSIARGLSLKSMGFALVIPFLAAACGEAFGGRLSDKIYVKTGSKRFARAYWIVGCFFILAVCLSLTVIIDSTILAIMILAIGAFCLASSSVVCHTIVAETVPEQAGSQGGLLQLIKTIPGIIAPIITGYIVDSTGSFAAAFYLTALIIFSGVLATFIFLRPPEDASRKIVSKDVVEEAEL